MYKTKQDVPADALFDCESLELVNLNLLDWNLVCETNEFGVLNPEQVQQENQEDTLDATTKYSVLTNNYVPVSSTGPPDREIFSGDLKFEVAICGADTNKSKFLYSHRLNRIYVDMGHAFSVQLKWDVGAQPYASMFVRATPVFSDQAQAEKRVTRCMQHYHDNTNGTSMCASMRGSVLRSTREVGTLDVYYFGGDSPDVWYSVLVHFSAPSTHAYLFACKNSCSSGINRRSIAILFTLEDVNGKVYGRQSVGVRVCSCPKRDMKREEEEEAPPPRKRPMSAVSRPSAPVPRNKRIRHDEADNDKIIQLPQISIVGWRIFNTGLIMMLRMTEDKRAMALRANQPTDHIDASIAQIKQQLERAPDV